MQTTTTTSLEQAINHGTLIQRAGELSAIRGWLDANREAPAEVRIACRRTIWVYQSEASKALQALGGLAAAW